MKDANDLNKNPSDPLTSESKESPKIVSTAALFAGRREICIEHEGNSYVLRITRRGKLILQK
jgi:hemin uptake protein HemP